MQQVTIPTVSEDDICRILDEKLSAVVSGPAGFLNVEQAADFLATTPGAIRSLVKRRAIPVSRTPNGRLLFTREELDGWVRGGGSR